MSNRQWSEVKGNIFDVQHPSSSEKEYFEALVNNNEIQIERIISQGHVTPEGEWYDQERDEWVVLVTGEASILLEGEKEITLIAGDYLFIPKHLRHRVTYTSKEPVCIWLAIHGNLQ